MGKGATHIGTDSTVLCGHQIMATAAAKSSIDILYTLYSIVCMTLTIQSGAQSRVGNRSTGSVPRDWWACRTAAWVWADAVPRSSTGRDSLQCGLYICIYFFLILFLLSLTWMHRIAAIGKISVGTDAAQRQQQPKDVTRSSTQWNHHNICILYMI